MGTALGKGGSGPTRKKSSERILRGARIGFWGEEAMTSPAREEGSEKALLAEGEKKRSAGA